LFDHRTPNLWTIAQRYTRCGDSVNLVWLVWRCVQ
jgi:hypothetical protein